jgi:hypothetical protein
MTIVPSNPPPAPRSRRSLKGLVSDLKRDAALLAKQEVALAKTAAKEKVTTVAKKAGFFGAAGILGYAGFLVLLAAVVLAIIAIGVVAWLATLLVGIVVLLGAFLLVQRARRVGAPREPRS